MKHVFNMERRCGQPFFESEEVIHECEAPWYKSGFKVCTRTGRQWWDIPLNAKWKLTISDHKLKDSYPFKVDWNGKIVIEDPETGKIHKYNTWLETGIWLREQYIQGKRLYARAEIK